MKLYYNEDKCPKCNELTDHYIGNWCKSCYAAYQKEYQKEYYKTNNRSEYHKEYQKKDINSEGKTLNSVRVKSRDYLFRVLNHNKLSGYEIHHCWGYEDYTKFVYIPRTLHVKIHQYLKVNQIDAKSNHYKDIVDIINNCQEYTYIHV